MDKNHNTNTKQEENKILRGTVTKATGSQYVVSDQNHREHICTLRGKIRLEKRETTNPVVVGDDVDFSPSIPQEGLETLGVINHIHTRKNYIIRRSVNLSKQAHIIAANIDQACLICTLNHPKTQLGFVDRFLIAAEAYGIDALLIFNKTDLHTKNDEKKYTQWRETYESIGYICVSICATELGARDKLSPYLKGKTSLLSGNSGVGKSTLLNTLDPSLDITTRAVSQSHKMGQHTTTFAQMYRIKDGEYDVIDTPGIKSMGLVDITPNELGSFLPEIQRMRSECKFSNCLHQNEKNCAVKDAVEAGEISYSRYKNYLSVLEECS